MEIGRLIYSNTGHLLPIDRAGIFSGKKLWVISLRFRKVFPRKNITFLYRIDNIAALVQVL